VAPASGATSTRVDELGRHGAEQQGGRVAVRRERVGSRLEGSGNRGRRAASTKKYRRDAADDTKLPQQADPDRSPAAGVGTDATSDG